MEVGEDDRRRQARQRGADGGHLIGPVDRAVAVPVAVDREQHLRLDLAEPVDHAAGAELRRAARPDRAERRGRQERDHRLRHVREVGGHPVAAARRRGRCRPARARATASRSSSAVSDRRARASATAPRRRSRRRGARPGAGSARPSSAARRGTSGRRASRASARAGPGRSRDERRSASQTDARRRRGRRSTSAAARRSPRRPGRARLEPGQVGADAGALAHVGRRRPEHARMRPCCRSCQSERYPHADRCSPPAALLPSSLAAPRARPPAQATRVSPPCPTSRAWSSCPMRRSSRRWPPTSTAMAAARSSAWWSAPSEAVLGRGLGARRSPGWQLRGDPVEVVPPSRIRTRGSTGSTRRRRCGCWFGGRGVSASPWPASRTRGDRRRRAVLPHPRRPAIADGAAARRPVSGPERLRRRASSSSTSTGTGPMSCSSTESLPPAGDIEVRRSRHACMRWVDGAFAPPTETRLPVRLGRLSVSARRQRRRSRRGGRIMSTIGPPGIFRIRLRRG